MFNELIKLLGYNLYCFRKDYHLTEKEMLNLIQKLIKTNQFKKEYGIKENHNENFD